MTQRPRKVRWLAGSLCLISGAASAAMGNIGTTYGVLPTDVASAQALSLFNSQVSATYYNPAYLARDPRGELTLGLFHADHELTVDSQGGSAPLIRQNDVVLDTPSQNVLIGMKTNLTSMTKLDHPLYLGFMLGVEKFSQEMLAFNSKTSEQGQFVQYGRHPLFLNLGGATNLWRGIDGGLSARITLHSDATLQAQSDLAGNTQYENLNVSAEPVLRPILGLNIDWGKTVCPEKQCWLSGLETAFAFRGYSDTRTKVNANAVIPGTIPPPGLTLAIETLTAFQPNIYTAGIQYRTDRIRVGVTGEFQEWSALNDRLMNDTIKNQGNLKFNDVWIPRVGMELKVNESLFITTGLSFEKSALDSRTSLDVNYLDNDRVVLGLGGGLEIKDPFILAFPLRLDFGYQHHWLKDRDFDLSSSRAPSNPYETVTAGGQVDVFVGSLTLKF